MKKISKRFLATGLSVALAVGMLPTAGAGVKAATGTGDEALKSDSYAGYLYTCFTDTKGNNKDVQQIHFYLSEDGLNWTALNGNQPAFLTGSDYIDAVSKAGANSVNYIVNSGVDISATVEGDASVLFPFEGKDQGVRDPYMIRGSKADGSDAGKIWLLATDLNTHSANYGPATNLANNICGDWGKCANALYASQSLFVWETEDFMHWTRRYVDLGSEVNSDMAWAPEAIYNPEKDNYLVYWSARTQDDGSSRDRLYCNETDDFVTFGPTMLYENEPFYTQYGASGKVSNSGYGNIDTSMLWVADEESDYGTLYRLVKDETNNHIELQSAKTVFDPSVEWEHVVKDASSNEWVLVTENEAGQWVDADGTVRDEKVWDYKNPSTIETYSLDGTSYSELADLSKIKNDSNDIKRAEIVYNWYKNNSTGDHFTTIQQDVLQFGGTSKTTYHEGATMFKFIDRDEWCIMVDNYGNMSVRYEPYVTTDLSVPNSVTKVASGYGRTAGDIGCHGTMIPITVEEYNTLIDLYNNPDNMTGMNEAAADNYHEVSYISIDKSQLEAAVKKLKAADSTKYSDAVLSQIKSMIRKAEAALDDASTSTEEMNILLERIDTLLASTKKSVPEVTEPTAEPTKAVEDKKAEATPTATPVAIKTTKAEDAAEEVIIKELDDITLCTDDIEGLYSKTVLEAVVSPSTAKQKITWESSDNNVVVVSIDGTVTAVRAGTAVITATASNGKSASVNVTVLTTPSKVTLNKKKVTLKKGKTFTITTKIPSNSVCSSFIYSTSNKKVATVTKDGVIKAKKKGTAVITVTCANNTKIKNKIIVKVK